MMPPSFWSLGRNLGSTRAVCSRCSPYCSLRWLSAKTKKSLSPLVLRMGSRKKYISADLFRESFPTRLCRDACAAPHFSKSLYVPSMLVSSTDLSAPGPYVTLYSEKRFTVHCTRSLGGISITDVGGVMPRVSCQLSTLAP